MRRESVLITGVTGFVGSHLAEYYLTNYPSYRIYGLCRTRSPLNHLKNALRNPMFELLTGDITDANSLLELFEKYSFTTIHHLAAQSFVPDSWTMGNHTLRVNIEGTFNLLQTIVKTYFPESYPKVHLAGSSEEYGLVYRDETPIKETNPLRPLSPYGWSKIAMENAGYQMYKSYGIPVFVTRAFNHEGIRRGKNFVTSNFALQVASQQKENPVILHVGNLEAVRDYTDVRDMVRAYALAVDYLYDQNEPVYECANVASGIGYKISQILDILSEYTQKTIQTIADPNRMRPSDVPILLGDASKFSQMTGWKPEIPFEQTMRDLYDYWVEQLSD